MRIEAANPPPSSISDVPGTAVRRRPVPAWAMSCALHTLILVCLAWLYQTTVRGAAPEQTRSGGIVLVAVDTESTEYLSEGHPSDSANSTDTISQSPPPLPDSFQRPPDLPGLSGADTKDVGVGDDLLESLPGANAFTDGVTAGQDVGGKVTTEVFGVKGTGNRFVYVFDKSDSMNGYEAKPLRAAKEALLTSLEALGDVQQFQIVFYNQDTQVFTRNGEATMFFGNEENKRAARRFVQGVQGNGGTDHLNALKFALSLGPDVIFLLTDADGGFTRDELRSIADWNRSGAVINAVEFGVGSQTDGDRSLETLVREHRGQYVYKNIMTLR